MLSIGEGVVDGISISDLTAPGLLLILILMLFTGAIVTKREHDDVKQQRDTWQEVAKKEQDGHRIQTEVNQTVLALLRSIKGNGTPPPRVERERHTDDSMDDSGGT